MYMYMSLKFSLLSKLTDQLANCAAWLRKKYQPPRKLVSLLLKKENQLMHHATASSEVQQMLHCILETN